MQHVDRVESLYPSVTHKEYQRRYEAIWSRMRENDLDAFLVYGDSASEGANLANCVYLTGYEDPWFSYVVVLPGEEPLLLNSNPLYLPHARVVSHVEEVDSAGWRPGDRIADLLRVAGVQTRRIGICGVRAIHTASLPHDHFRQLAAALPGATWVTATEILAEVRRIKSAEETDMLRTGAAVTDHTVAALATRAEAGMSELQLGGILRFAASERDGVQRLVFVGATSMEKPELTFPRQTPSTRRFQPGDILLTELSASYAGYPGQIHRPFAVGGEPTSEYSSLFEVAVDLFEAVVGALAPGRSDTDVRGVADPILERADMWTMDTLVHGWGLSIEPPRLDATERVLIERPQEPVVFLPGMTLVVQPHVVSSDRTRGLQVGSLVAVTEDGAEPLQRYPMEFGVLDGDTSPGVDMKLENVADGGGGLPGENREPPVDRGGKE